MLERLLKGGYFRIGWWCWTRIEVVEVEKYDGGISCKEDDVRVVQSWLIGLDGNGEERRESNIIPGFWKQLGKCGTVHWDKKD